MSYLAGTPENFIMPDGHRYFPVKTQRNMNGWALFSYETHQFYRHGQMDKKKKARYMRVRSGMRLGAGRKERLDFLTLTTAYNKGDKDPLAKIDGLNYAFKKMKQQIEYWYQKKQYVDFCRKNKLKAYVRTEKKGRKKINPEYKDIFEAYKFKLRYFKVKTAEGGGVLHIIYRKPRHVPPIPQRWLSKQWQRIWQSSIVDISEVDVKDQERMSMYLVGRYFVNQPVLRMSYGQQWVCLGFVKKFKHMIEVYGFKRGLQLWNKRMDRGEIPENTRQRSIYGRPGNDKKWHSKRYPKQKPDKRAIYGLDRDVKMGYHMKWWNLRLDSPKYIYGYYREKIPGELYPQKPIYFYNTLVVDK